MTEKEIKSIQAEAEEKAKHLRAKQLAEVAMIEAEYEATKSAYKIDKRNKKIDNLLNEE